jgi:hypothetical protein
MKPFYLIFSLFFFTALVFAETPDWTIVLPRCEDTSVRHYNLITWNKDSKPSQEREFTGELEQLYYAVRTFFRNTLDEEKKLTPQKDKRQGIFFNETKQRYRVVFYRDKEDYVNSLKNTLKETEKVNEAMLKNSLGFYHPLTRTCYFFSSPDKADERVLAQMRKTIFHEGTHQLLQDIKGCTGLPGTENNFWIAEGIAMVMETFQIHNDRYTIGNAKDNRLYAAKTHRFDKGGLFFYVPFEVLVKMGKEEYQGQLKLARLYSQSAGMTHFLLFYENGKYRRAALELLRQVYAGTSKPETLSNLTKQSCKTLDREYGEFIKSVP